MLPVQRPRAERGPVFHGWKVVSAGAAILMLHSALIIQSFGTYAVVLKERFGWSNTTMSVAYSFNRAESGLLGPVQARALDRFGSRRVIRFGAVLVFLGFLWFSQVQTPLQFVLAFVVISVGAGLSGFMSVTTEVVGWFEQRRSRALSVVGIGFALGGLAVPLVTLSIRHLGWRETAVGSGLLAGIATFVIGSIFGTSPADHGTVVDGTVRPETIRRVVVSSHQFTASEAIRTRAFWLLAIGHSLSLLVVSSVIAHLPLFLTDDQGFSLQRASIVAGSLPVAQLFGMLIGGVAGDRMNKRLLCSIAMIGHMAGLLMLTFATNQWMVWGFVVLHGLAWGMRGPFMNALRADYFGSASFGQIMGWASMVVMIGQVGGPLFAGILADATGDYRVGFTILALLAGSGSIVFALATPPEPPGKLRVVEQPIQAIHHEPQLDT